MTLKELIKDKELPVRVTFKDSVDRGSFLYFEIRYILNGNAFGHYVTKAEECLTSNSWPLYSEAFELYKEPTKKKTITLKKYQIVYKHYDCGYISIQNWFENEQYVKEFFTDAIKIQYLEGHDIEIEVDNE
jgi:hypothetical protein